MSGTRINTSGANILLVDDNPHGLLARKVLLQELGYSIETADSCEQALDLVSKHRFDLVVTDYRMPNMNGTELIERIRSSEPATLFIVLSGFVEPLGLTEESTGADAVIPKSAGEVGHLVRSLKRLLPRRSIRKPAAAERPVRRARFNSAS
jgi:CheY-like chemotaxis protein